MLTPFKLGVGGVVGSGKQWMSWISLDDVVADHYLCDRNENLRGAVNVVSPNPVTNEEFTKTLGRCSIGRLPAAARVRVSIWFSAKWATHCCLIQHASYQSVLLDAGYEFKYTELKSAIEHAVK